MRTSILVALVFSTFASAADSAVIDELNKLPDFPTEATKADCKAAKAKSKEVEASLKQTAMAHSAAMMAAPHQGMQTVNAEQKDLLKELSNRELQSCIMEPQQKFNQGYQPLKMGLDQKRAAIDKEANEKAGKCPMIGEGGEPDPKCTAPFEKERKAKLLAAANDYLKQAQPLWTTYKADLKACVDKRESFSSKAMGANMPMLQQQAQAMQFQDVTQPLMAYGIYVDACEQAENVAKDAK